LTRAFGVHIDEEGLALRGTFIINPEGMIKTMEVHSNEIARDVKETLRKLKAAQYTAANPGQVCPAKWNEGAKTIDSFLGLGRQDLSLTGNQGERQGAPGRTASLCMCCEAVRLFFTRNMAQRP